MILVKDLMTENPVCVKATDLVTRARSLVRDHGCRALPVLDNDKLIGIVSRGDILKITSNKTNIEVRGIMSRNPIVAAENEDIVSAAKKIIKSGIRQLPVINNRKLVGMVSSRDILDSFIKHVPPPREGSVHIRDIMSGDVVCCEQDDELSKVWDKMYESGFSGLPVIKENRVIGIITRMDIFKHGSVRLSKESGRSKTIPVKKAMQTPVIMTTPDASVRDAAEMIVKSEIVRMPVVDEDEKLVGIVDIEDMLRAYVG